MPLDPATLARLRRKLRGGLVAVAQELVNQAKVRATAHVDTGELRNSITYSEVPDGVLFGLPDSPKHRALELGFAPHWVPGKYIGGWMGRNKVGQIYRRSSRSVGSRTRRSKPLKRAVAMAAGLYVGGPNSTLDYGPGGTSGMMVRGKSRVFKRWMTKGQRSDELTPGKVGFSVVRWTVRRRLRAIAAQAFAQGYRNG
ncbi:MAG: HK97 gp10 family phage protein [Thermaceae bacterium]|nr:HK97 gp10 family phage protein [Thermaceae bacterium]